MSVFRLLTGRIMHVLSLKQKPVDPLWNSLDMTELETSNKYSYFDMNYTIYSITIHLYSASCHFSSINKSMNQLYLKCRITMQHAHNTLNNEKEYIKELK